MKEIWEYVLWFIICVIVGRTISSIWSTAEACERIADRLDELTYNFGGDKHLKAIARDRK